MLSIPRRNSSTFIRPRRPRTPEGCTYWVTACDQRVLPLLKDAGPTTGEPPSHSNHSANLRRMGSTSIAVRQGRRACERSDYDSMYIPELRAKNEGDGFLCTAPKVPGHERSEARENPGRLPGSGRERDEPSKDSPATRGVLGFDRRHAVGRWGNLEDRRPDLIEGPNIYDSSGRKAQALATCLSDVNLAGELRFIRSRMIQGG